IRPSACAPSVHEDRHAAAKRQQPRRGEPPSPDAEEIAERVGAPAQYLDDTGRRVGAHRIAAALCCDTDAARHDDDAAVCEQFEVHREPATARAMELTDGATVARRSVRGDRLVARPGADRPRVDRAGRRDHGEPPSRRLVAAAAMPQTNAISSSARLAVAGRAEMTTPCRKTPSEPRLIAAAAPPRTPATVERRAPCERTRSPYMTAPSPTPRAMSSHWMRPVGASATENATSDPSAATPATAPSAVVTGRPSRTAASTAAPNTSAARSQGQNAGRA